MRAKLKRDRGARFARSNRARKRPNGGSLFTSDKRNVSRGKKKEGFEEKARRIKKRGIRVGTLAGTASFCEGTPDTLERGLVKENANDRGRKVQLANRGRGRSRRANSRGIESLQRKRLLERTRGRGE